MKLFKTLAALALVAPVIAVCASGPVQAAGAGNYDAALKEAKTLFKEAEDIGGAWSNTEEMIASAEAAAAAGNRDEAMKLLQEAIDEANNARNQAEAQKDAGPHLF